ncbi:MAG: FAD binding domain-containing protein [Deltaproteobacteria bacterium]|nr:FAD binding domain-containing protein [Deltaproteobacteria bacterium]
MINFFKPASVKEALLLKAKHCNRVTWFAGGTHINRFEYIARHEHVISLEALGLHFIQNYAEQISVGAMVTLQELMDSRIIPEALRQAAAMADTRSIRNMATIGGDIASGGKETRLAPCLMALHATVTTAGGKTHRIEDYITRNSTELILNVTIPSKEITCVVRQVILKANGPVLANTAVSMNKTADFRPNHVVVAVGTVEDTPRRLPEIEKDIRNHLLRNRNSIEKAVSDVIAPETDQFASRDYKTYITGVVIADSLISCLEKL